MPFFSLYSIKCLFTGLTLIYGGVKTNDKQKSKTNVMYCSVHCILHFAFSLFFSENVFVNSRSDFNLQIQLKPFELLMVASDLNLSVCISFIILMLIVFKWVFFKLKWRCVILTCIVNYLDFMPWQMQFKHV